MGLNADIQVNKTTPTLKGMYTRWQREMQSLQITELGAGGAAAPELHAILPPQALALIWSPQGDECCPRALQGPLSCYVPPFLSTLCTLHRG